MKVERIRCPVDPGGDLVPTGWPDDATVARLRVVLAAGGVVAVPTESSYGLAVDPRSAAGVGAIYRLKVREEGKPLPVVIDQLTRVAMLGADPADPALIAAAGVWPAALSVVIAVEAADAGKGAEAGDCDGSSLPAAAGTGTVAVRVPENPLLRAVLAALAHPLTATSANPSGAPPLVDPEEVVRWLAAASVCDGGPDSTAAVVLDAGVLPGGAPSTLIRWAGSEWRLLRAGRVALTSVPLPPLGAPRRATADLGVSELAAAHVQDIAGRLPPGTK